MANFSVCYEWMMDNEDAAREHAVVPDAPPGAHAISGINSSSFPQVFEVIAAHPQADRGPLIKDFYNVHFWNSWFDQLNSDEIAKRVFDASVNMGSGAAVKLLQRAIEDASSVTIGIDGFWGTETLQAANNCNPTLLCAMFKAARVYHYREIIVTKPQLAVYLQNWLTRARK